MEKMNVHSKRDNQNKKVRKRGERMEQKDKRNQPIQPIRAEATPRHGGRRPAEQGKRTPGEKDGNGDKGLVKEKKENKRKRLPS